jgi:hypothetical protein
MKDNELEINGEIYVKKDRSHESDCGFNIVILDKGFVYVGKVQIIKETYGDAVYISNAKNLRVWGTRDLGLGFLVNGPTKDTTYDKVEGVIVAPLHSLVHMIAAKEEKWRC